MPKVPYDIPSGLHPAHGEAGGLNVIAAPPPDMALETLELDENDYLAEVSKDFSEWLSAEDEVEFRSL